MRDGPAIIIFLAALFLNGSAAEGAAGECFLGLRRVLLEGGFSGPLECSKDYGTFLFVGKTEGSKYSIYDYRYRFIPKNGNIVHGGQRILVIKSGKFVGQYVIPTPPYKNVSVLGSRVLIKVGDDTYYIELSKRPPKRVFVDGDPLEFFK